MTIIAQIMPYSTAEVPRRSLSICETRRCIAVGFLLFGMSANFAANCVTNWLNRAIDVTNFSTDLIVAAVALLDDGDRVLMQKRREETMQGGLWEFPGGKLESGESTRQAAVREIFEELGLTLEPADLVPVCFASGARPDGQSGTLVIVLYTCRTWRGAPECRDAEAIEWFAAGQLAGLAMPPLDYPLASGLVARLGAASD